MGGWGINLFRGPQPCLQAGSLSQGRRGPCEAALGTSAPRPRGGLREGTHTSTGFATSLPNLHRSPSGGPESQKGRGRPRSQSLVVGGGGPSRGQAEPPLPAHHRARRPHAGPGGIRCPPRHLASAGRRHSVQRQTMENLEPGP